MSSIVNKTVSQYVKPISILSEHIMMPNACSVLKKQRTSEILVVDDIGNPIGIVTDDDILKKIGEANAKPERTSLGDIMTFPVISVKSDATLLSSLDIMKKNKIKKLVVVTNDNKVLGIIFQNTISEIIKREMLRPRTLDSNFKPILWNLGIVLQFTGVLMFIPALLATYLGEFGVATGIFLTSTMFLIFGFILNSYGEKQPLSLRGTAILVFVSFVLLVSIGSIPYLYLNPYHVDQPSELLANSIFSSSASFTTAGISLFDRPEELPQSLTFYQSFSQFVGGLSFIYLIMIAFYPEEKLHNIKGFISGEFPKLKELLVTITIIFIIYAFIMTGLLWYFGQENLIDNFSISMSTLSTGGLVPRSNFLNELSIGGEFVIISGMILGALPFSFHYYFVRKKFLSINLNKEVVMYLMFLSFACALFFILHYALVIDDIFTVIATSTTSGFQIINISTLDANDKAFLTIIMLIGGCGFSTAGGIKIFRVIDMVDLQSIIRPARWKKATIHDKNKLFSTLLVFVLFPTIPLVAALYFSALGFDFYESYFEAIGAITTAGIGSGDFWPHLDPLAKIVTSFLMILGRLEIILIVYLFIPKLMK